jgi:hypothetical protein
MKAVRFRHQFEPRSILIRPVLYIALLVPDASDIASMLVASRPRSATNSRAASITCLCALALRVGGTLQT